MMTGSERVAGARRIWRQTSMPETRGSIQSSSTSVGPALGDPQQRLLAIAGLGDREALLFEVVAQHRDERRFVLDDQDERLSSVLCARSGAMTSRLDLSPFGRASVSGVPCTR